jgi:hypothetical protein
VRIERIEESNNSQSRRPAVDTTEGPDNHAISS